MDDIITGLSNYYGWLVTYCQFIVFEYQRFLKLENKYKNLRPPETIEQCWQFHILNIDHYYKYCNKHFGNVLAYKPVCFNTCTERNQLIQLTLHRYLLEYGSIKYQLVWNNNPFTKIINHNVNKAMTLHITNKTVQHMPLLDETILTLREIASQKFRINIDYFVIFIEGNKEDICTFNLEQIYRLHGYKYENGYGFKENNSIPDKIKLLDLHIYGFNNLRIHAVR